MLQARSGSFRFGPYEADARARELRKHGVPIHLQGKSFQLLAALLEHPQELVTREELRHRLWPDGVSVDFDNSLNTAVNLLRDALRDHARRPRYIETLPRRGYRFIAPVEHVPAAAATLAVLPFANLSRDPEQDFWCDGVSDALITELGGVRTLRVLSRQSVLHLKGTRKTAQEIAEELNTDAIVEGSILREGNRIRITAQLIQTSPEQHLWAKAYECQLGDVLTVQGRVAQAIGEAVQSALTPDEKRRLSRVRRVDAEAHLAYLKGRHHMGQWSRESFERALVYFRLAVEKDPTHALAHAHMADCYGMLGNWGHRPFLDAFQSAKHAALQALALDDELSTAHWAYGWATWICDWDLATCRAEMLRAIDLNPSDEHAHAAYSIFLVTTTSERVRAVAEMRLALDLDPLSPYLNALMAWTYVFVRDYDRASEQALKSLEMFPESILSWWGLGLADMCRSRHADAIRAFEKAMKISQEPLSIAYLGAAHARSGHIDVAETFLRQLLSRCDREPVPPRCLAFLYAATGDQERAFEWLEKAYEIRDSGLFWLRVMPLYDPLRSTLRFEEMLRRLGLPPD